ncbi:saccharopine dehydrogenase NADP-binding domain-containing protein [Herbaspirillum sp. AP02]|uniref:saccharopine dehydrogenase family protein n=1 Tax=unclassified Herbaspirillum TaxID=2624150 RepID=UPI0015DA4DE9|nr:MULTISPECIES: saccharopine dehydrogenase NADP-binding domain-containing protein [unclassified Herbaspirillum]MBG7620381.1 saccharopine dehydrogenase NADP-binding domain-containing protein [Herbaspirillum sp. AP02]NZD67845.1 saccharopine dehydrogenase NADP-binding domain-containing protein [Herbaspirillum sp. AP21]
MRTVLLGSGHIGQTIARLLSESGDYNVTIADRDAQALKAVSALNIEKAVVDSSDAQALEQLLRPADIVINALPYHMAVKVAGAARNTGTHYFDLTEDVQATRAIAALAADAPVAFMPQCGLAPGFIGIAAHHLAGSFDEVHDVKMRVGALPQYPTNELKYNLTWSVDGLVNEYCHPCEALRDGTKVAVDPLADIEHFSLDGVEYEAFNTSGGLGTLCETLAGRIRNLDYKSVRYPGHQQRMKFLLSDLGLKHDQELLKNILRKAVPTTMQDVVLVFVTVSGMRGDKFVQEVFTRKIFAIHEEGRYESAIQSTTAAGVCTAVDLFRNGKLPQRGFISQEAIGLPDFLANRFGQVYA